ncbi:DNA primase, partial [Xylella fastidiosa subsp. fastidiosa]
TKSALGIEAVERQVHAAVSKAIDNHQKRVQQQTQQQGQHEQKQERRRLRVR